MLLMLFSQHLMLLQLRDMLPEPMDNKLPLMLLMETTNMDHMESRRPLATLPMETTMLEDMQLTVQLEVTLPNRVNTATLDLTPKTREPDSKRPTPTTRRPGTMTSLVTTEHNLPNTDNLPTRDTTMPELMPRLPKTNMEPMVPTLLKLMESTLITVLPMDNKEVDTSSITKDSDTVTITKPKIRL